MNYIKASKHSDNYGEYNDCTVKAVAITTDKEIDVIIYPMH